MAAAKALPVFLALLLVRPTMAQQAKISGLMFGDAYAIAAHDDPEVAEEADKLEGRTGLWFRRIYLTFDYTLSDNWKVRLRTEMGSAGDFSSNSRMEPFAKDAFVQWKKDNHQIWNQVEDIWGYRSVAKTLIDMQRIGASRDMGIAFQGTLDPDKKLDYNFMLGNGSSTGTETNKGKKAMLALGYHLTDEMVFEVYTDYEDRPGDTNRFTLQGFLGYSKNRSRAGLQYVYQSREVEGGSDVELTGLSVFGAFPLQEKLNGFVRFDKMLNPNPEADRISYLPFFSTNKANLLILGIEYQPIEQVHFMPNATIIFYDEANGFTPGATVMPRVSFFITFG